MSTQKPLPVRVAKQSLPTNALEAVRPLYNSAIQEYHSVRYSLGLTKQTFNYGSETYTITAPPAKYDLSDRLVSDGMFLPENVPLDYLDTDADYVLDIGAHYGLYSLLLGALNPDATLISFEPSGYNRTVLQQVLSQNQIDSHIIPCPVLDETRPTTFYFDPKSGSESHATTPNGEGFEKEILVGVSVSDVLKEFGAETAYLKIDAEGEELAIVEDIVSSQVESVSGIIELHPDKFDMTETAATQYLEDSFTEVTYISESSPNHPDGHSRPVYYFDYEQ